MDPGDGKASGVMPAGTAPDRGHPAILAIGASAGGPAALARLLSTLPASFSIPVVMVQHILPSFTASLASNLGKHSALPVHEASDGEELEAGRAYLAPGGRHMGLARAPTGEVRVALSHAPPENYCRPAVDYLFRSVAATFGGRAAAVILTGIGRDGTEGMRALKALGAWTLCQDKASCEVYGMPGSAREAGIVDLELDPEGLARALSSRLGAAIRRVS